MRNKQDIDEVDIDDLYNNLMVYEDELKRSSGSNSASQNLAFLSSENTNSTNEVSTASGDFGVSTAGGINQQMDEDDLEELVQWQVAMLTVRVKKFIQRTGRNMDFKEKRLVSLDKSNIECYNCHRIGHFARECRSGRSQRRRPYSDMSNAQTTESSSQVLVAQDGLGGYYWSNDFEVKPVNYALMAISSSNSSSSYDSEGNPVILLPGSASSEIVVALANLTGNKKIRLLIDAQDKDSNKGYVIQEGQHQMPADEQVWQDELEMMVTQELAPFVSTGRSSVSTDRSNTPNVSAASTSIDASDTLPNNGILNGAYDDEDVGAEADFHNIDNTIAVSPIPALRIHKDHPKGQILGDPTSAS
ncbi:ribonuclease H-like domain-containing protein [Tanacetum coccineum]